MQNKPQLEGKYILFLKERKDTKTGGSADALQILSRFVCYLYWGNVHSICWQCERFHNFFFPQIKYC